MTPAQSEAMDAVAHMTPKEIKEFASMLIRKLNRDLEIIEREQKLKSAKSPK